MYQLVKRDARRLEETKDEVFSRFDLKSASPPSPFLAINGNDLKLAKGTVDR